MMSPSNSPGDGFCHDSAKAFAILFNWGQGRPGGGSIVSSTPVCCCCDSIVADRRRIFRLPFLGSGRARPRSSRHLRRRGRARGPALADRAVEGRAFARHLRRGEAARGRAFADRARWTASRPNRVSGTAGRRISGSPRSPRRPRGRGTRSSRATARRPSAARSRAKSPCAPTSRRGRARRRGASGPCAIRGIARRKTCIPHGSRSSSMRRSTRRCRGRRCMKCCAIDRAISCSTIWVSREDQMGLVIRPDCADLPYFLRAYFAFKMGLPFGYSKCTRGGGGEPPKCYAVVEHSESRNLVPLRPPPHPSK